MGISLAVAASSKPHNFPGAFSPQLEISALTKSTVNLAFQTYHLLSKSPDHRECHMIEKPCDRAWLCHQIKYRDP